MTLQLTEEYVVGVGYTRRCYRHPLAPLKCIKIMKETAQFDVNWEEFSYYQYLIKKNKDLSQLPKVHGFCMTNFGEGLVFDLVGGRVTLDHSLSLGEVSKPEAFRLLKQLQRYLIRNGIAYMDTKLSNLIITDGKLVLIDGIVPVRLRRFKKYGYIWILTTFKTRGKIRKAKKRVIEFET